MRWSEPTTDPCSDSSSSVGDLQSTLRAGGDRIGICCCCLLLAACLCLSDTEVPTQGSLLPPSDPPRRGAFACASHSLLLLLRRNVFNEACSALLSDVFGSISSLPDSAGVHLLRTWPQGSGTSNTNASRPEGSQVVIWIANW